MFVVKSSLCVSLPLPSIPMELTPSPCAEKVYAFLIFLKCMNTISRGFQMIVMGLKHLRLQHTFIFPVTGIGLARFGMAIRIFRNF